MQPRRGQASRSSLPINSNIIPNNGYNNITQQHASLQQRQNIGALAAQALTSSLANPYGQPQSAYQSYTNPNYHAYFLQMQRPLTTAEGYSISSTYNPAETEASSSRSIRPQNHSKPRGQPLSDNSSSLRTPDTMPLPYTTRAQGDFRCGHEGCVFSGSRKTVEIHKMDRHLIFPPGWKKPPSGWDADPLLKGKPVPIPGTGLLLNTPEAIEAWISERKTRWPSKKNIEDKKRKAQEALDRGEIDPSELTARGHKRRRFEGDEARRYENQNREYGWRGRGRGNAQRGRPDSGWTGRGRGRGRGITTSPQVATNISRDPKSIPSTTAIKPISDDSDSDSSNPDMDPVKDAISSKAIEPNLPLPVSDKSPGQEDSHGGDTPEVLPSDNPTSAVRPPVRKPQPPRAPPHNPFATRRSLLRNLLLPEIRHTVSNLSQAIHFIVDNDFFDGFELRPGEADSPMIKVLNSTSFPDTEPDERSSLSLV